MLMIQRSRLPPILYGLERTKSLGNRGSGNYRPLSVEWLIKPDYGWGNDQNLGEK